MTIEWIAHSCFKITLEDGRVILFDPFDSAIGYTMPEISADVVLISHDHYDHNCTDSLRGDYVLIREAGVTELDGIRIEGIPTYHDHEKGAKRGRNMMFKVTAEGLNLLHMGDVGEVPDEALLEKIGAVDILFIPVGGVYTIDAEEALETCKRIDPNIIVPMHYKTLFLTLDIDPVFKFTDAAGRYYDRSRLGGSSFSITSGDKKKRTRIMVMENSLEG